MQMHWQLKPLTELTNRTQESKQAQQSSQGKYVIKKKNQTPPRNMDLSFFFFLDLSSLHLQCYIYL